MNKQIIFEQCINFIKEHHDLESYTASTKGKQTAHTRKWSNVQFD